MNAKGNQFETRNGMCTEKLGASEMTLNGALPSHHIKTEIKTAKKHIIIDSL